MKLQINQPIIGIKDRGMPTESKVVYADKGDRVSVLFDNTYETISEGMQGHYVCVKDDLHFIVFNSQYDMMIKERDYDNTSEIITENDLLYPKSTEEIEDTILE
jgi:hypothetical protein